MGTDIAPTAPLDIDVLEIVHKLCDEEFYKSDYKDTTVKLISDSLTYDEAKNHYRELAEKVFCK